MVLEALLESSLDIVCFDPPELVVLEGAVRSASSLQIGVSSHFN